ncbi:ATP-binding protein [Proteinivorax tanatarense]|uniref:histidine kinase n=1 Tax=Proteinivorax tanatarense TaxID=1260629 RepID=A0AAU7VIA5_9FIRM
MKFSIRGKLTLTYGILFLLIVIILGTYLSIFFADQYISELSQNLSNNSLLLSSFITDMDEESLHNFAFSASQNLEARVTIIGIDGQPIAETSKPYKFMDNHLDRPEIQKAKQGKVATEKRYSETIRSEMLYSAAPIYDSKDQLVGFVRLAKSLEEIDDKITQIRFVVYGGLLVGLVLVWVIGGVLSKAITKPLRVLMNKAKRAGEGKFSSIKEIYSNDEIGELEEVINDMGRNLGEMVDDLDKERLRLRRILDNLPVGVLVVNNYGVVLTSNSAAGKIFEYQNYNETTYLNSLIENYNINEFANEIMETGEQKNKEITLKQKNGDKKFLHLAGAVVYKSQYAVNEEAVIVIHDVSDLKQLELIRKDLVANVSHELRTPLTAVQGFAETLLEEELDCATQNHFLRIIKDESTRLSELLNDLLALSKLEGDEERKSGVCNVKSAVLKVLDLLNNKIKDKKHKVHVNINDNLDVGVYCDYLEQVMLNYVENAIKYTPEGSDIKISAVKEDNGFVRLIVRDNGPGIPIADQERVFERFFRVDRSRERKLGGTGLGLSIVKHIVEGFGGNVGVVSNKDGTSFWATLPKQKEVC